MNENQGWINLYKPKNISSFKAIYKIKKKFSFSKIGHAGTLDPQAEGILPIAIGKATKLIPFINNNLKKYNFTISWGVQTSTDDSEGDVMKQSKVIPELTDIEKCIKTYVGTYLQTPPQVSAVKVSGERAYKLARRNQEFQILPKEVFVKKIRILKHQFNKTSFTIESGKGFYIRSLARDIGIQLGTFGHISSLERVKVGKFTKETSILLDDLLKISERLINFNCLIPSISMLDDILAYEIVDQKDLNNLSFGRSIKINEDFFKVNSSGNLDKKNFFLSNNGNVVSIGKLVGNLFKPNKILL
ncbi:MAG: tRNA pseudouridine(55) synthase TruB [Alphaproteobacteria bacterium]